MPSPTNAPAPPTALVASAEGEPVTDLDHARYDRDGWMESALRAQGYVGELQGRLAAALARAERAEKALEAIRAHEAEKAEQLVTDQAAQNIAYLQANIAQMERFMERGKEADPIGFMQWASRRDEFQRELDAALAHPAPAEET